jgi:hypothetical protein
VKPLTGGFALRHSLGFNVLMDATAITPPRQRYYGNQDKGDNSQAVIPLSGFWVDGLVWVNGLG